ncbi:MAG: hypothetical protein KGI02_03905 [Thaumarchaeota archaeon]|nr:hypothetical protein [Nitrososphaerota archaeon]MDE2589193.1 hypothetical protein [Patescibacteria group bacterium]
MTDPSHEPFVNLVLNCCREYSEAQIRDWLSGGHQEKTLAKAFEAWSKGDTATVLKTLNPEEHAKQNDTAQATPA